MVWVRDRISKALGVNDHPEALETLMKEHQEEFQAFLDDEVSDISGMEKCVLYIYRTFYDRLVEREVVTIEKGELFNTWATPKAYKRPKHKNAEIIFILHSFVSFQFQGLWHHLHHQLTLFPKRKERKEKVRKGF